MSYEVRQPRSGSNPRLISFSRLLRALLLLALMVFFLPCDAQVCDSMVETSCLQTILDKLAVASDVSWRLAAPSHERATVRLCSQCLRTQSAVRACTIL